MYLLDKVTRDFLLYNSNDVDMFMDAQDPTYMSFKLDFFPDKGMSIQHDSISNGGLFRPIIPSKPDLNDYNDSAIGYLYNIGSPKRCAYLQAFTSTLYKLQEKTPWFFQSISGLGELYKVDKSNSYRTKDKSLTISCLESIDMRMSFLADLYRNFAYDMEMMKEILPENLRTFNMNIYVLEFRRFNTTYGKIANYLRNTNPINKKSKSVSDYYSTANKYLDSTISMGSLDPYISAGNQLIKTYGGVGGLLLGDKEELAELESAFEAITIHAFELHNCEFDFFSTEPDWLSTVSNSDVSTPAASKLIIKPERVFKVGYYPFFNFVVGEYIKHSVFNQSDLYGLFDNDFIKLDDLPELYLERHPLEGASELNNTPDGIFAKQRQSIYPVANGYNEKTASSQAYIKKMNRSNEMQNQYIASTFLNVSVDGINNTISNVVGKATPGVIQQATRETLTSFMSNS